MKKITIIALLSFLIIRNLTAQYYVAVSTWGRNNEITGWYESYNECYKACNQSMNTAQFAQSWNNSYGGQITGQISGRIITLQSCKCREATKEEIKKRFGIPEEKPQPPPQKTNPSYPHKEIDYEQLEQTAERYTDIIHSGPREANKYPDNEFDNGENGANTIRNELYEQQQIANKNILNDIGYSGKPATIRKKQQKTMLKSQQIYDMLP
ncbi:MAG: hypothetical protein LBR81_08095 [Prevotellaceae bacterium]|nr:hypothetical protein [Prevotellaceae bacterium]